MKAKQFINNQRGFTLIEIIAVLVLIGILAAVAVPKYMDMQGEAKKAALDGALGAAAGNVQLAYAKNLLANSGTQPTTIATNAWDNTTDTPIATTVGDFTAGYSYAAGVVTITLSAGPAWFEDYKTAADKTRTITIQ